MVKIRLEYVLVETLISPKGIDGKYLVSLTVQFQYAKYCVTGNSKVVLAGGTEKEIRE